MHLAYNGSGRPGTLRGVHHEGVAPEYGVLAKGLPVEKTPGEILY